MAPVACCLDAEWDQLITAHTLLKLFPTRPTVHHIKGHQDRSTPYDELDPIAQMNVDADLLATVELKEYGRIHDSIPFDPACGAALSVDGRTITRDIERTIQEKLFLTPLQSYMCNRFNWSNKTFESIDWGAFSQVYSQFTRSRKFFYQFGWKKLPTGARLYSRESRFDDRCPSCQCPDESDDHIFRCNHVDRRKWRYTLIQGIRTKLSVYLDPELLDMICIGLYGYFRDDPVGLRNRFPDPSHDMSRITTRHDQPTIQFISPETPTIIIPADDGSMSSEVSSVTTRLHHIGGAKGNHGTESAQSVSSTGSDEVFQTTTYTDDDDSDYDPEDSDFTDNHIPRPITTDPYIQLRQEQDSIGWDHFLRGKMSSSWQNIQYLHAVTHGTVDRSKNWQSWLIKYLTNQSYSLWETRNKKRHGKDNKSNYKAALEQARRGMSAMYHLQSRVLPRDRDLFGTSLDRHLQQPLSQLQNWLSINRTHTDER